MGGLPLRAGCSVLRRPGPPAAQQLGISQRGLEVLSGETRISNFAPRRMLSNPGLFSQVVSPSPTSRFDAVRNRLDPAEPFSRRSLMEAPEQ